MNVTALQILSPYHIAMGDILHGETLRTQAARVVTGRIETDGIEAVFTSAFQRWSTEQPEEVRDILAHAGMEFGERSTLRQALLDAHVFNAAVGQTVADLQGWQHELAA